MRENKLSGLDCKNDAQMVALGLRVPELVVDRTIHRKTLEERVRIKNCINEYSKNKDLSLKNTMIDIIVKSKPHFNIIFKMI